MLVIFPLLDFMAQVLPSGVEDPLWRSNATARLGEGLPSVLLGLFAIFAVALQLRHKRALRLLSVVCGASATVCVASLLTRAVDHWDVRTLLTPQEAFDFGETSFVVNMKYLAALLLLCTLATIAWQASPRAWRGQGRRKTRRRDVFGQFASEPTGDQAGGPEGLDIAEVQPLNSRDEPTGPGSGEPELGDLPLAGGGQDIEPIAPGGSEGARPAVKADAAVGRRRRVAGGGSGGTKGRRKPGRNPKTGAEIPAPPDDVLRTEVRALVDEGESLTSGRRKVAGRYGIGLTTVRNRTK